MKLSREQVRKLFVEYLYEELPEDQMAQIRQYLEEDPLCRAELEEYCGVLNALDAATREAPPGNPTAGLLQRINYELDSRPGIYRRGRRAQLSRRLLALAASILFILFSIYMINQWYVRHPAQVPEPGTRPGPFFSDIGASGGFLRYPLIQSDDAGSIEGFQERQQQIQAIEQELDGVVDSPPSSQPVLAHPWPTAASQD